MCSADNDAMTISNRDILMSIYTRALEQFTEKIYTQNIKLLTKDEYYHRDTDKLINLYLNTFDLKLVEEMKQYGYELAKVVNGNPTK